MNKELIEEAQEKFEKFKEESGLWSSFDELDNVFLLTENMLHNNFTYKKIELQIYYRVLDFFSPMINSLHEWLSPNPNSMVRLAEGKIFLDTERKELTKILRQIMTVVSQHHIVHSDNPKEYAQFIDYGYKVALEVRPTMVKYHKKVSEYWMTEYKNN